MRKILTLIKKKAVNVSLSILDPSKTVMYDFWYDCVEPKYKKK